MKNAFLLVLTLIGTPFAVQAQTSEPDMSVPYAALVRLDSVRSPQPLPVEARAMQFLIGSGTGIATSAVVGYAGLHILDCSLSDETLGGLCVLPVLAGVLAGHVLGSALGVHVAGIDKSTRGSFGVTLLGSTAGTVVSALVLTIAERYSAYVVIPVLAVGPPLFATLFNNTSRRYRTPSQQSGLLNLDRGSFALGIPAVNLVRLADPHRTVARSVRLLTASW